MINKKDGFQGERSVVLPPVLVERQENDALTSSLFVTDIGFYPLAEHHHRIRHQAIDQYVLIYCVEGSGYYVLDGKRHEVRKNQYFILPAGKPHEYGTTEGDQWTIYWLHFRGNHAHIYAEGATLPQDINIAVNSRIKERIDIFEEILSTLYRGTDMEDLRYASSLLHHFLASMRYLQQFRSANDSCRGRGTIEITDFSTVFKKKTGLSPLAYFNQLKVQHACELLKKTDLKMNQICYKVGIEDSLYFSRLFSKIIGMSPTEYRKAETKNRP